MCIRDSQRIGTADRYRGHGNLVLDRYGAAPAFTAHRRGDGRAPRRDRCHQPGLVDRRGGRVAAAPDRGGVGPVSYTHLTLLTNLGGALLIGLVVGMSGRLSQNGMLFWKSGVCGGFTTFSTFSLEALRLFEGGKALLGTAYAVSSVLLCLLGVFLGECAGRRIAL